MLEPPAIADEAIAATLKDSYGLEVASMAFLPLGLDSAAWAYRVQVHDGGDYFLKLRSDGIDETILRIARYLSEHREVPAIAPIPALNDSLWSVIDGFASILYPFVDGSTGTDRGLDEHHWITYGTALRRLHDTSLPPDLARTLKRETFVPAWSERVARLDALLGDDVGDGAPERGLATLWRDRRSEILALVARTEALGRRLRATPPPLVLCHADIHTWNVLIDTRDRFWIVDWDETVLAAKECDLMFVVGGLGSGLVKPEEEAWFLAGYGDTSIDPLALAYYRTTRAVDEICEYAESILLIPDTGEVTKQNALEGVQSLFAPGSIVSLAYAVDPRDS